MTGHLFPLASSSLAKTHWICFPYAGGSHQAYKALAKKIPHANLWVYEPPGHIFTEGKPINDINQLAELYLEEFPEHLWAEDLILLGHSFGAYMACTFAAKSQNLIKKSIQLILCAAPAPGPSKGLLMSELELSELIALLVKAECIDKQFVQSPDLLNDYYPALKADFQMYDRYVFPKTIAHLKAMIVCAYEDKLVATEKAFLWKNYFSDCSVDFLSGGHLFINEANALAQFIELILVKRLGIHYNALPDRI